MRKHLHKLSYLVCFLYLITMTGCASIVSKNEKNIFINSDPDGAKVEITDERGNLVFVGKTPLDISLKTGESYFHAKSYTVDITKEGYERRTALISSGINGWYFGNFILGGVIGLLIVDPITGAMWTINPERIDVKLDSKTAGINNDNKSFTVMMIDDVPEKYRDKLVKIN